MFLVNSRLDRFTAAPSAFHREGGQPTGAPLLPKLRGQFAEFLNEGYLDHLSIFYLPTCVGFGTGTCILPRGFSRRHGVEELTGLPASPHRASHKRALGFTWEL